MKRARAILVIAGFAALGGSIAWGLLGDVAASRDQALLDAIQDAEDAVPFAGVRTIATDHPDGAVTTVLRVRGRGGERHIEFVEARLPGGEIRRPGDKPKRGEMGPFGWMGRIRGIASGRVHGGQMARFRQSGAILQNYRLVRTGREPVAGRDCDRLELRPRSANRASYRLWADVENRFLLRFQVIGAQGGAVFDMSHDTIAFHPTFVPDDFAAPVDVKPAPAPFRIEREALSLEALRGLNYRAWLPAKPPAGFQLRAIERLRARGLFEGISAWYSDGMASVMIVQFRADNPIWVQLKPMLPGFGEGNGGGLVARRIAHAGGTLMNITLEGTEVFVAGQIVGDEMEQLVKSLKAAN